MKSSTSPAPAVFLAIVYNRPRSAVYGAFTYDPRLDTLVHNGRLYDPTSPEDAAAFHEALNDVMPNRRFNVEGRTNRLRVRVVTQAELDAAAAPKSPAPAPENPAPVEESVPELVDVSLANPAPEVPEAPETASDDPFSRAAQELQPAGIAPQSVSPVPPPKKKAAGRK